MALQFQCPHCQTRYEVADGLAGKSILCRACGQRGKVQPPAGPAATKKPTTRRGALLTLGGLAAGLLAIPGVYYWSHPLPWERFTPRHDNGPPGEGGPPGPPPGRGRGRPPRPEGPSS
jgi:predicted Zn finger-like uncharacterized protein